MTIRPMIRTIVFLFVATLGINAHADDLAVTLKVAQPGAFLAAGMLGDPLPLALNMPTQLTATTTGGPSGSTQYQFAVYYGATHDPFASSPVQASNVWSFTPSTAGTYLMRVYATRPGASAQFTTPEYRAPLMVTLTVQPSSSTSIGTPVALSTTVAGAPSGVTPKFLYMIVKDVAGAMGLINSNRSIPTMTWTPTEAGTYHGQVEVKLYKIPPGSTVAVEIMNGFATFYSYRVSATDPSVLTWTSPISTTNFPALSNPSIVTPAQRILIEGVTLADMISSVKVVRDTDHALCSQCHSAPPDSTSGKYRPNVVKDSAMTILPTALYNAGAADSIWATAGGFADRFILRDGVTVTYAPKPLYLRELFKRWRDGGYQH
jgi:hypothetical protein